MSLDEAMEAAAEAIEGRVAAGSEIAVYKITASHNQIGDYLAEGLNDRISMRGRLVPLARGEALRYVDAEHQFQMSGSVSDASAVGIGHYLGAKVVVTGTFDRYADFSQFRLRAIDVRTSALLYSYTAWINNGDRILANITAPFGNIQAPRITETALDHLNRGNDLLAEDKYDGAIAEFDKALAIDRNLADAYMARGEAYVRKGDYNRARADFNKTIRLDPNNYRAYLGRAGTYFIRWNFNRAIADNTQAIRLNPNDADMYYMRGLLYSLKMDRNRAIADFTQAIRINPNYAEAYYMRGNQYIHIFLKSDYDSAIADYTQAIRINPNYANAYDRRGDAYYFKRDYNRAITDYEAALRIDPNHPYARESLEDARRARARGR